MNITRNSTTRYNKKKDNSIEKVPIVLDIKMLDAMCKYILSDSQFIRRHHLINLKHLLDIIDYSTYSNDLEKSKRISFINKGLESRLELNMNNKDIIFEYIQSRSTYEIDFVDLSIILSLDEINWINDTVTESLRYSFFFDRVDQLQDICARFKTTDYRYRGDIVEEAEQMIDLLKNDFRRSKVENMNDTVFSLREGKFEDIVTDTWNTVTSPSHRLYCGMQGLNQMTNGFESGRVYMLLGMASVGKSITLLNLIYQMKKANAGYKTKDGTKTPCIVLLTMENTITETITRLFDLVCESNGMENYSVNEVISKLRNEGELLLNDNSPIDIVVKYKPNRSVDTGYLYNLVDDLEDDGYEVICLVQDHIKRIRSTEPFSDLRLELGEVVNELKVFAAEKDIPVITDSHLNREAAKVIEAATQSNKADMTRMLGKSNIGESMLMIDNLDMAIIINKEFDKDGNMYMVFSTIKMRDKSERTYIAQPFVKGSGIRLVEDLYMPMPLFKESLHTPNNIVNERQSVKRSSYSDISALDDMFKKDKDDDTLFKSATKYSSNIIPLPLEEDEDYDGGFIPKSLGGPSQPYEDFKQEEQKVIPFYFYSNIPQSLMQNDKVSPIYFLS